MTLTLSNSFSLKWVEVSAKSDSSVGWSTVDMGEGYTRGGYLSLPFVSERGEGVRVAGEVDISLSSIGSVCTDEDAKTRISGMLYG